MDHAEGSGDHVINLWTGLYEVTYAKKNRKEEKRKEIKWPTASKNVCLDPPAVTILHMYYLYNMTADAGNPVYFTYRCVSVKK